MRQGNIYGQGYQMTATFTKAAAKVALRQARIADVLAIESLLNRCYRGNEGWTNEVDLVGGIRTTSAQLQLIIKDPDQYLFVYPKNADDRAGSAESGELLACICVSSQPYSKLNDSGAQQVFKAYIGMFAVHPKLQGQGVGNAILSAAETFACQRFSHKDLCCYLTMSILNHRPELLAYYQRRGYRLTGGSMPFPKDGNNGEPLRDDLRLLTLEKVVQLMR